MHRAQAQQPGAAEDADKGPVQDPAPGSSRAAESYAALNGAVQNDISKILFPPKVPDEATKYFRMCNEIIDIPETRRKHYPKIEAFRRVRSWAGAVIPEGVETCVKANFSKVPTTNRPFLNMKKPREVSDA
jgi:hypothetical protein